MLPLRFGMGWLTALVLGTVLSCGPVAADEEKPAPVDSANREKRGRDVEEFLYRILRQDGCLRYAKTGFELYVKRVQGRKLLETQFNRRDPKTQQTDLAARAREAQLSVDVNRRRLLIHMRYCHVTSSNPDDGTGWFENKVWDINLPEEFWK